MHRGALSAKESRKNNLDITAGREDERVIGKVRAQVQQLTRKFLLPG